jgi:hypothetical protein
MLIEFGANFGCLAMHDPRDFVIGESVRANEDDN